MKMKLFLAFVLTLIASAARGQIYIDSYRFAAVSNDLLLDSFPNAAAAYSLRKLDKDYIGNVITVRRINGDTSNIGFSGNYLDTVSLKSFCGSSSSDTCWVRTWFDQSGNARNGRQTTNANQPQIVRGGAIFYDNGEPALRFDGTTDFFAGPSANIISGTNPAISIFAVVKKETTLANTAPPMIAFGNLSPNRIYFIRADNSEAINVRIITGTTNLTISGTVNWSTSQQLISSIDNGSNINVYRNDAISINNQNTSIGTFDAVYGYDIGNFGTDKWIGSQQELIIYLSNQTNNRTTIQNNINRFYSIY